MNTGKNADLPLGLGMALMQNADAFLYFSALDKTQQAKSFVNGLTANG